MAWTLIVAKPAQKQAARLPARDQARIAAALSAMADDPFNGDVLKLEGEKDRWRRRVGDYRVFFTVDKSTLTVAVSAVHRNSSPLPHGRGSARRSTNRISAANDSTAGAPDRAGSKQLRSQISPL